MTIRRFKPPSNMLSTLREHRNAIISFTYKTGNFIEDPETLNRVPEQSEINLEAIVKTNNSLGNLQRDLDVGVDISIQWIQGKIVNPVSFPKTIKHQSRGKIKFGTFENDIFTELDNYDFVLFNPDIPHALIENSLGSNFSGYYTVN